MGLEKWRADDRRRRSRRGDAFNGILTGKGFTLIELLMVIVIIGLISAVSVPTFRGYMQIQKLNTAARDIVTNLRFARLKAVSEKNQWVVLFMIGQQRYFMFADDGGGNGLPDDPRFIEDNRGNMQPDPNERTFGPYDLPGGVVFGMVTAANLPNGITISQPVSFSGSPPRIVFYPDGSARETGVIMMHLSERILETNPEEQRAVVLYRPTGFARAFKYNPAGNPSWK